MYDLRNVLYKNVQDVNKLPLRLMKIKMAMNAEHIDQINRSGIFEGYNVVSVRRI